MIKSEFVRIMRRVKNKNIIKNKHTTRRGWARTNSHMINYYFKKHPGDALEEIQEFQRGSWVYVEKPKREEIDALKDTYNLDVGQLHDAMDIDEIPRYEKDGDVVYIFVRFLYQETPRHVNTAPLLFIYTPDHLITMSPVRLPILDQMLANTTNHFSTLDPAALMLKILYFINVEYDTMINRTSKEIKHVRARLAKREIGPKDFETFINIEDTLSEFLSSLRPISATLKRFLTDEEIPSFKKNEDILEDLILNNGQSVEACTTNLEKINSIRRNYAAISSHNLDRSMRILAVAAVLIALPNLFYGMYGMNINLPFQHEPWAYEFILGVSLLVMLAVIIAARRRRLF